MKSVFKYFVAVALIASSIFSSCKKDDKKPEEVKPTVEMTEDGLALTFVQGDDITLTATFKDNVELQKLVVNLTYKGTDNNEWNHGEQTFNLTGLEHRMTAKVLYEIPDDALPGTYILKFDLYDQVGNIETWSKEIVIEKADTEAPAIEMSIGPDDVEYFQGDDILMEGALSDDKQLAKLTAEIASEVENAWSPEIKELTLDGGTTKEYNEEAIFTIPEDATPGEYTITFTVFDDVMKSSTVTKNFIINRTDKEVPKVMLSEPTANGFYGRGSKIRVITEVSDDLALNRIEFSISSSVENAWAPEALTYMTGEVPVSNYNEDVYEIPLDAVYGEYTLKVVAYDNLEKASDPVEVVFQIGNLSPVIEIVDNSLLSSYSRGGDFTFKYKATDDNGLAKIILELFADGNEDDKEEYPVELEGDKERIRDIVMPIGIDADLGSYKLRITAIDQDGAETQKEYDFVVTKDTERPTLQTSWTNGSSSFRTYDRLKFNYKATDNVGLKRIYGNVYSIKDGYESGSDLEWEYELGGAKNVDDAYTVTLLQGIANGNYRLYIIAEDVEGNIEKVHLDFTYENTYY